MENRSDTERGLVPGKAGLWALLLCSLYPMVGLFALGPAMPVVAAAFKSDPNAALLAQLMGGASGFAFAVSSPLIGMMIERWTYRRIYIASLIGFAVVGTLPALMDNLWWMLATRLLLGVTVAGAITAGITGLGLLPESIRPRMFGRNAVVSALGAVIAFPAVGAIATLGWRAPFLIHLLSLLVVPLALRLPIPSEDVHHDVDRARGQGIGVSLPVLALCGFVGFTMYIGPMFSPFYLRTIGVTDPALAAVPLSVMSVASLFVTSSYAFLHTRLGTVGLFGLLLGLMGIGLIGAGVAQSVVFFSIALFTVSCGMSLFTPNLNAYIVATSSSPARGIGWAMSAMFAVQVAFPFVAQGISSKVGPAAVFYDMGAVSLAISLGFVFRTFLPRWRVQSV